MTDQLTILGSGTSFGVPVIGCSCEVCTSSDPRDRRTRTAALIELGEGTRILIDTPPELRLQLVTAGVGGIDAVLYTHDHADHVHGIDDLRAISSRGGHLPVYGPPDTLRRMRRRFDYIFDDSVRPPQGSSKPELIPHPIEPGVPLQIAGAPILPIAFDHGRMTVYGYRFGHVAYVTDVKSVPEQALESLRGVRVLVINALFEKPHAAHLSIPEAIDVIRAVGAERGYLTHLTHRYGHQRLVDRLPEGVEPAYDGLRVTF